MAEKIDNVVDAEIVKSADDAEQPIALVNIMLTNKGRLAINAPANNLLTLGLLLKAAFAVAEEDSKPAKSPLAL